MQCQCAMPKHACLTHDSRSSPEPLGSLHTPEGEMLWRVQPLSSAWQPVSLEKMLSRHNHVAMTQSRTTCTRACRGFVRFAILRILVVILCWFDRCFDSWVFLGLFCLLRVTQSRTTSRGTAQLTCLPAGCRLPGWYCHLIFLPDDVIVPGRHARTLPRWMKACPHTPLCSAGSCVSSL